MLFSFYQLKSCLRLLDWWVSLPAPLGETQMHINVWDYLPTIGEPWPHSKGNEGTYCLHGASGIWLTCFLLHNFHMYQLRFQCPALWSNKRVWKWNGYNPGSLTCSPWKPWCLEDSPFLWGSNFIRESLNLYLQLLLDLTGPWVDPTS